MLAYYGPEWESLASRIVGRWCPSFSGNTGLQLPDTMGRNHGTLTSLDRNAAWQTNGGALSLALQEPNGLVSFSGMPTQPLTIAGWFAISQSGTNIILSMGGSNTNAGVIATVVGQGIAWYANAFRITQTSTTATLNRWYHFVLSVNQPPNYLASLYVDGVLVGTSSFIYSFTFPTWLIGSNQSASIEQMRGWVDDFIIFNTALTANEVRFIYDQGRGGGMLYQPPRRRSYFASVTTFKNYWFRNQQRMIGGGIR